MQSLIALIMVCEVDMLQDEFRQLSEAFHVEHNALAYGTRGGISATDSILQTRHVEHLISLREERGR